MEDRSQERSEFHKVPTPDILHLISEYRSGTCMDIREDLAGEPDEAMRSFLNRANRKKYYFRAKRG